MNISHIVKNDLFFWFTKRAMISVDQEFGKGNNNVINNSKTNFLSLTRRE